MHIVIGLFIILALIFGGLFFTIKALIVGYLLVIAVGLLTG